MAEAQRPMLSNLASLISRVNRPHTLSGNLDFTRHPTERLWYVCVFDAVQTSGKSRRFRHLCFRPWRARRREQGFIPESAWPGNTNVAQNAKSVTSRVG